MNRWTWWRHKSGAISPTRPLTVGPARRDQKTALTTPRIPSVVGMTYDLILTASVDGVDPHSWDASFDDSFWSNLSYTDPSIVLGLGDPSSPPKKSEIGESLDTFLDEIVADWDPPPLLSLTLSPVDEKTSKNQWSVSPDILQASAESPSTSCATTPTLSTLDSPMTVESPTTTVCDEEVPSGDKDERAGTSMHDRLYQNLLERGFEDRVEALMPLLEEVQYHQSRNYGTTMIPQKRFATFLKRTDTGFNTKNCRWYSCCFCHHSLQNQTQMVQHLMGRHFEYKPFLCENAKCNSQFYRRADLRKHAEDKHTGRKVQCTCGKTYTNDRNLKRHRRSIRCKRPSP